MNPRAPLFALLLLVPGMACADPLGRLFYTPAQRAQLDVERNRPNPVVVPETPAEPTPAPPALTYSGVVRRNDGKATVWINNRAVPQGEALSGVAIVGSVRRDGAVRLQLPQTNAAVDLKVGQTLQVDSGTVAESYMRHHPDVSNRPASTDAASTDTYTHSRTSIRPKIPGIQQRDGDRDEEQVDRR